MNCPICNITLLLSEKQGVEIDYCPQCRGIWLDRGELEKIIDKTCASNNSNNGGYISEGHHYDKHDDEHYQEGPRRKKGLFDFFD
jgi:Zn-finger nucleic acid-binding protein